ETHVFIFTKVVYVLEITPKLDVVILSLALVAATLGGGLGLLGRRHVFHWRLYLARFQVHVHRFGVRDRAHLCLVEPTQATNRERHTALGFGVPCDHDPPVLAHHPCSERSRWAPCRLLTDQFKAEERSRYMASFFLADHDDSG